MAKILGAQERGFRPPFHAEAVPTCLPPVPNFPIFYQPQLFPTSRSERVAGATQHRLELVLGNESSYLLEELGVSRLNKIHSCLWLAGLQRPAFPLQKQISIGHEIVLTESADLHLLWKGNKIFIKPLPDWLLLYSVWEEYLSKDETSYGYAAGFLLSYLWLIRSVGDLRLAHEHGLLNKSIDWEIWTTFGRSASGYLDFSHLQGINKRYHHGELRLMRINWIVRLYWPTWNVTNFLRGYAIEDRSYGTFAGASLSITLAIAGYIAIVLNAMQVGLSTQGLADNTAFQRVSAGFAIFAMIAPLAAVVAVISLTVCLVLFNLVYIRRSSASSLPSGAQIK